MEAEAAAGPSLTFVLFAMAGTTLLAVLIIQSVRGRLRWLWLNRHGLPRVVWRLLIFVVLLTVTGFGVMYGLVVSLTLMGLSDGDFSLGEGSLPIQILGYLVMTPAVFAASAIAVRRLDRRAIAGLGLGLHSRWLRQLSIGMLLGITLVSAIISMQAATGTLGFRSAGVEAGALAGSLLLTVLTFIGVAFLEELLFRGYVLQVLAEGIGDFLGYLRQAGVPPSGSRESAEKIGNYTAAALLAVPFGIAHYGNDGGTFVGAVATGLGGLALSVAYFRTRSLWLPVGLHITWNFSLGWVFSAPVSGELLPITPFTTTVSGPEWLSGGTFGPEASVLTFLALTCMIVYLVRSRRMDATADAAAWYPPPEERLAPKPIGGEETAGPGGSEQTGPAPADRPSGSRP
jgi:membrane protease YdiL (CAAX protease family)